MKIAVRAPNWLGDLMMATSFFSALRFHYPTAEIEVIVPFEYSQLPYPGKFNIIEYDKKKDGPSRFGFRLRSRRYEKFYVLPPSFSSAWMAFCSGAQNRVGYAHHGRGVLLNKRMAYRRAYQSERLVNEWLKLIDQTYTVEQFPTSLEVDDEWFRCHWPAQLEIPNTFVAVAPGAFRGSAKRWPPDKQRDVVYRLAKRGLAVVIVGSRAEHEVGQTIVSGLNGAINICGKTSLNQLIAVLNQAQVLLCNDSGLSHVMAALKKPQVTIFGSSSPIWTGPDNPRAKIIYEKQPCSPCFDRECRFGHTQCLMNISVEQVCGAVDEFL